MDSYGGDNFLITNFTSVPLQLKLRRLHMKTTKIKLLLVAVIGIVCLVAFIPKIYCQNKCCSPCVEVSIQSKGISCRPTTDRACSCDDFDMMTWDKNLTGYPNGPRINLNDYSEEFKKTLLFVNHPYLARVKVYNLSKEQVRGVVVTFSWASHDSSGYNSNLGTPIGSVAVDLDPNSSKWVRSPWFYIMKKPIPQIPPIPPHTLAKNDTVDFCVKISHPCDSVLTNNYCWRFYVISQESYKN
jgi:hypothetical protein